MAYTAFDKTKPDASTQAGTAFGGSTRANLLALRDCIVALGAVQGWNMTPSGGTAEEPTTILYSSGAERVRLTLTWTSGNVTKVRYEYSSNSGSTYDNMIDASGNAYQNIAYDGAGNVTSITWSTS